jgi:hypothetical protein
VLVDQDAYADFPALKGSAEAAGLKYLDTLAGEAIFHLNVDAAALVPSAATATSLGDH